MKILMFLDNNCRYDSRVLREAKALAEAGHDVRILAFLDTETAPFEQRDGFRIVRVTRINAPKRNSVAQFFHAVWCWLNYYWRSWLVLRNAPADVYHCHDLLTLPLGYLAKLIKGGKLVYDSHELYPEQAYIPRYIRLLYKVLERYFIRHADRVITVNELIAAELSRRYGVPPPSVLLNCPPLADQVRISSKESLRSLLGLPGDTPIALYIGGYTPGRGLHNLILSAHHLNKGIIVLMGYGALEEELRKLVGDNGLSDKVAFAEPVPPDELIGYISTANVGIVIFEAADLNNYYASPNKFFEYMNAGLPVICSDFPFMKALVESRQLGKTCNPEDPQDIALAINWVLADEKRYAEIKNNVQEAAKVFNWENEAGKLVATYGELEADLGAKD